MEGVPFRAMVAYAFQDKKGKIVYTNKVGPFEPRILYAIVQKVLNMPNQKDLKRKKWLRHSIRIYNPDNGHEFTWTPRGWAETKLPLMKNADVEKIRELWKDSMEKALNNSKFISGKKAVLKINGQEIKVFESKIEVSFESPRKKE